ncbi:24760_t:CDS:2, partial [Entrophospora sp. SA101]
MDSLSDSTYFHIELRHQVTVELKNDLAITGILSSVDQFLNIKLDNIRVIDDAKYPHMIRERTSKGRKSIRKKHRKILEITKFIAFVDLVILRFNINIYVEYITIDDTEKDHEIDVNEQEIILTITP